jgi:hypothetical protein
LRTIATGTLAMALVGASARLVLAQGTDRELFTAA